MAQETFAIPQDGGELINWLNNNFTELYTKSGATGITIQPSWIFKGIDEAASETARDDYFVANPGELIEGIIIAVWTAYDGEYTIQTRLASSWGDVFVAILIDDIFYPKLSDETTENVVPIKQGGRFVNSDLSYNPTLARMESAVPFYASSLISDSGSFELGDSTLSSGGRLISTESSSTGNRASFELQLFDDNGYKKATVFDHTQPSLTLPIQDTDDTVASGVRENNFIQVVQADVQFMKVQIKPEGGTITAPFYFEYLIDDAEIPAYNKIVEADDPDLIDLGGGLWQLTLSNPTIFDAGNEAKIKTTGISLLGGNGFDGTGGVLFGDPDNNDFFPYLKAVSIIIVRKNTATEEFAVPVTLASDDTTQETLDLTAQEVTVNLATQTTDGVMSSGDKLEHDNLVANGAGDSWISGGLVIENSPKDQKVSYGAVSYQINGIIKTVTPAGLYDLENAFGSIDHYSGMIDDQHAFVNIYVDNDQVIKSERGVVVEKGEIAHAPLLPDDSVCISIVEIKVDKNDNPKDIRNKDIEDCRHSSSVNTDRTVSSSADDETTGYLIDKISSNGNVVPTIENAGSVETIRLDVEVAGGTSARLQSVRSLDLVVTGTGEVACAFDPAQTPLAEGLSIDGNGNILVGEDGFYTGNIKLYVTDAGDPELIMWLECKPLATGVWELCNNMIKVKIKDFSGWQFPLNGGMSLLIGDEVRVKFKVKDSGDTATFKTTTEIVALGTQTQYAASIFAYKIGDVTP